MKPISIQNGWFVHGHQLQWGAIAPSDWWGGLRKQHLPWTVPEVHLWTVNIQESISITRHMPGLIGPGKTEDLDQLTDVLTQSGYLGFEHYPGLWYDRRRDYHDTERRKTSDVIPPFFEMPWSRTSYGQAWDGKNLYDLEHFNPWYFDRIREFVSLCDQKGLLLYFNFYDQHALLECDCHYVDFPWRPANCLQQTGMPDRVPAALEFYDTSHPERRRLHEAYINRCLQTLGDFKNVVFLTSKEYTGSAEFMEFWLHCLLTFRQQHGLRGMIGLGATKDVLDSILTDPELNKAIDVLDLRYWWYDRDDCLNAPAGGQVNQAGRYMRGIRENNPEQIYRQINECRQKYPDKAVIQSHLDIDQQDIAKIWALILAGGAMTFRRFWYDRPNTATEWVEPPEDYQFPASATSLQPTISFINQYLSQSLIYLRPFQIRTDRSTVVFCRANPECFQYLIHILHGTSISLNIPAESTISLNVTWFDPIAGKIVNMKPIQADLHPQIFAIPDNETRILWISPTIA